MIRALACLITAAFLLILNSVVAIYSIAAIVTTLCAASSLLRNNSRALIYPFQLGALIFIFPDGFIMGREVFGSGGETLILASKYICVSICMLHCGYWVLSGAKSEGGDPKEAYVNRWSFLITVALIALYVSMSYQFTMTSATAGRAAALDVGGLGASGRSIMFVASMILPSVVLFISLQRMSRIKALLLSVCLSAPVFISLLLQGNRFPLFYSAAIFLCVYQPRFLLPSVKVLKNAIIITTVGLIISAGMVKMRDSVYGLQDNGRFSLGVLKSEGILDANASMIEYFSHESYSYGSSIAGIFLFWVPRAVWPNKPELLGYWLPRKYSHETLSDSQSVGFGFSGNGYVDFGFGGGLIVSLFIGMGLARLDRFMARLKASGGFNVVIASTFLPFSFFLARNLDTGIIISIMLLGLCLLFKIIYFRRIKI